MTKRFRIFTLVVFSLCGFAVGQPCRAEVGDTERVSVSTDGAEAESDSYPYSLSADGRLVAFESFASNLVMDDTNGQKDVFVHDRQTGETTRASLSSAGEEGNGNSWYPRLSADGRFVAFYSDATNLVAGDTNGELDVFVRDRYTNVTTRVSLNSEGGEGDLGSWLPSLSADGRYVAFCSSATNLVPNDTNGTLDVFAHDRQTAETFRVSLNSESEEGNWTSCYNAISADGQHVAFSSWATNLVPDDTSGQPDVFVHERHTGETFRVSMTSEGEQSNSYSGTLAFVSISGEGRFVAFDSVASNLVPEDTNDEEDVFVHDRQTGQTTRVSVNSEGKQGDSTSRIPSLSVGGRFVTFSSSSTNLVPDDDNDEMDVFVHDRQTGMTTRASLSSEGIEGNSYSALSSLSADGRFVAFASHASNLVLNDTNFAADVFLHHAMTVDEAEDLLSISLTLSATSFGPGDTMNVGLDAHSLEVDFTADVYFCALMPDGQTLAFIVDRLQPGFSVARLDGDARSFVPLYSEVAIPLGFAFRAETFFSYTFSDHLPEGEYTLFVALVPPGVLEDGILDSHDLLELAARGFTYQR